MFLVLATFVARVEVIVLFVSWVLPLPVTSQKDPKSPEDPEPNPKEMAPTEKPTTSAGPNSSTEQYVYIGGAVVIVIITAVIVGVCLRRNRRKQRHTLLLDQSEDREEIDGDNDLGDKLGNGKLARSREGPFGRSRSERDPQHYARSSRYARAGRSLPPPYLDRERIEMWTKSHQPGLVHHPTSGERDTPLVYTASSQRGPLHHSASSPSVGFTRQQLFAADDGSDHSRHVLQDIPEGSSEFQRAQAVYDQPQLMSDMREVRAGVRPKRTSLWVVWLFTVQAVCFFTMWAVCLQYKLFFFTVWAVCLQFELFVCL